MINNIERSEKFKQDILIDNKSVGSFYCEISKNRIENITLNVNIFRGNEVIIEGNKDSLSQLFDNFIGEVYKVAYDCGWDFININNKNPL